MLFNTFSFILTAHISQSSVTTVVDNKKKNSTICPNLSQIYSKHVCVCVSFCLEINNLENDAVFVVRSLS